MDKQLKIIACGIFAGITLILCGLLLSFCEPNNTQEDKLIFQTHDCKIYRIEIDGNILYINNKGGITLSNTTTYTNLDYTCEDN